MEHKIAVVSLVILIALYLNSKKCLPNTYKTTVDVLAGMLFLLIYHVVEKALSPYLTLQGILVVFFSISYILTFIALSIKQGGK